MSRWEAEALLARLDKHRSDDHGSADERRSDEIRARHPESMDSSRSSHAWHRPQK